MGLPPANLVLFFLSAFVGLWGASVVFRGLHARREPGTRRCPECGGDMVGVAGRRCPGCEFEAGSELELQRRRRDLRVVLVGVVAATLGMALVPLAFWVRTWETTGRDRWFGFHPLQAVFWGVAAFGLVMVVWGWRGDRSRGRRRCPKCWYDMRGTLRGGGERWGDRGGAGGDDGEVLASVICPECGHEAGGERALYRPRRRLRLALLGVVVVLLGVCGQTVPRALESGAVGLVPTTVLIGGMRWLPESWYVDPSGMNEATFEERMWNDEVWGWQQRWARGLVRSSVRSDVLGVNGSVASIVLDIESAEDRAAVMLGMIDVFGDPSGTISASDADGLADSLGGFVNWWGTEGDEDLSGQLEAAVLDHAETLLLRAETGGESEALLCLELLLIPSGPIKGSTEAILVGIREGGPMRTWAAAYALGRGVAEDESLIPVVRGLLEATTRQERRAGVAAVKVGADMSSQATLTELMCEVMLSSGYDDTVFDLALALANQHGESGAVRGLLGEHELPPAAAAGFALSWTYDSKIVAEDVVHLVLSGLRSDRVDHIQRVFEFCERRASSLALVVDRVLPEVRRMLGSDRATLRAAATRFLVAVQRREPAMEDRVAALFKEFGIDPGEYLTPNIRRGRP